MFLPQHQHGCVPPIRSSHLDGTLHSTSYLTLAKPARIELGRRNHSSGWLPHEYTTAFANYHPRFLPELIPYIIPGLCARRNAQLDSDSDEVVREEKVIRSTLFMCCLVSREWNRVFIPILYADINIGRRNSHFTQSLLHRTLQFIQPSRKIWIKTIMIAAATDGSTANLLWICFTMPHLHKLILSPQGLDPSKLHLTFVRCLRSLSQRCTIQIGEGYKYGMEVIN